MAGFKKRGLWGLTLPLFAFAFMSIGVSFADQVILSQYSEELAAAVSLANQILGVAYDLSALFSVGGLIALAQYLGRTEVDQARTVVADAVQASLMLCGLLAAMLLLGAPLFVDWINAPEELRDDVVAYVRIIAAAILFNGAIASATAALKGFGHTMVILLLGIFANVAYLFFEYALVFGAFGFPELAVEGSALATVVVRLASVLALYLLLRHWLGVPFRLFALPRRSLGTMLRLAKIAYPSVGENMIYNLYQLGVVAIVATLGTQAVLARSFSLTILSLLTIIGFVVAQGCEILVGYDRGAGEFRTAHRRARTTALATAAVSAAGAWLIYLNGEFLVRLFTDEAPLIAEIQPILLVSVALAPFQAANLILFAALKAVGDVNRPVVGNLALTLLLALPAAYATLTVWDLGVLGLWYVYVGHEIGRFAVNFGLWESGTWRKYRVIEARGASAP